MEDISPWVAFGGGLLSLLSPCVLPMIPVYVASLTGPELFETSPAGRRMHVFFHSLFFIIGFSIVFTVLGIAAGQLGLSIGRFGVAGKITGGLMVLFGLFLLAAPKIKWLNYERRLSVSMSVKSGYLRSLLLGLLFAVAWTPCVGPVLGGIMSLAIGSESPWTGGSLLAIYSLGMAVPFLVIGLAFDSVSRFIKRINAYSSYIYMFSGILLVVMGVLTFTNNLHWLTSGF